MGKNLDSHLNLRPIRFLDVPKWLSWLWNGREKNALDSRMFDYKRLKVVVSEREDGTPVQFTPIHEVLMVDSLAWNPEANPKERLQSAMVTFQNVIDVAKSEGYGEIVYVPSDPRFDEFLEKHFGVTKIVAYRKVLCESQPK